MCHRFSIHFLVSIKRNRSMACGDINMTLPEWQISSDGSDHCDHNQ